MMKERRGIVFPLILMAVGTVWLMQTLCILGAGSWWMLTRLWPILLIAIRTSVRPWVRHASARRSSSWFR